MRPCCSLVLLACCCPALRAQTLDQLRDEMRQAASRSRQMAFVAGFVDLSEDRELSAASMHLPSNPGLDIDIYKLPYQCDFDLGKERPGLHFETGLGYFVSKANVTDLWSGQLTGLETGVHTRWEGISGYAGLGPRFDLGANLHLTALADGSVSYLENTTRYEGPGAPLTAALADGILFNWHATTIAYGGALRLEHELPLSAQTKVTSLLRYDLRQFDSVRSTDSAQDATDLLQRAVARSTVQGPTGGSLLGRPLDWNSHLAYTRFVGNNTNVLGFIDYFEIGGGLAAPLRIGGLPLDKIRLSGAILIGEDIRGWTFGVSVTF